MKIVSIDIETSGIDHDTHQILEVGAVIDDLIDPKPFEELPRFHTYLIHDEIIGHPFALSMHPVILRRIAKKEKPYSYTEPKHLGKKFVTWLEKNGVKGSITAAGKCFGAFDLQFLRKLPRFNLHISSRVLDPAMFYWQPGDEKIPDTLECMKRAGIEGEVAHTALEDAEVIVKLIRKKFPTEA
jgi:oligoribonuclease (3'-5' exoribonuclease)